MIVSTRLTVYSSLASATLALLAAPAPGLRADAADAGALERALEAIPGEIRASAGLRAAEGPLPGLDGFVSAEGETGELRAKLPGELPARGGLSAWVRVPRTYLASKDADKRIVPLIAVEEVGALSFRRYPHSLQFAWRWDGLDGADRRNVWLPLPGIAGPQWYHLAATWDAPNGRANLYINGTPIRTPGTAVDPFDVPSGRDLVVRPGDFALADVRVHDAYLEPDAIRARLPAPHDRIAADLLGGDAPSDASIRARRGELIHDNPLAEPGDVDGWTMEGPGEHAFEDGWLHVRPETVDAEGKDNHFVFWTDRDLPESFVAEWDVQILSDHGLCIVFFAAEGRNGKSIFHPSLEPRTTGSFGDYIFGDIDAYHISYFADTPFNPGRVTSNMRKNHGALLVANGPVAIPPDSDRIHTVRLLKDGPRVQLAVDGRLIIDFRDRPEWYGPVLDGGHLGFRQMNPTAARYRDLRIFKVKDGEQ